MSVKHLPGVLLSKAREGHREDKEQYDEVLHGWPPIPDNRDCPRRRPPGEVLTEGGPAVES